MIILYFKFYFFSILKVYLILKQFMTTEIVPPAMIIITGLISKNPTNTATITAMTILLLKLSPFLSIPITLDKISAATAGLIPEKI